MAKESYIMQMGIYTVKKNKVKEVVPAVKAFVKTVNKSEHGVLMYTAFQKKTKPHEFIHLMAFKNKKALLAHTKSAHVKKFMEVVYPSMTSEPVFIDLTKLL